MEKCWNLAACHFNNDMFISVQSDARYKGGNHYCHHQLVEFVGCHHTCIHRVNSVTCTFSKVRLTNSCTTLSDVTSFPFVN